MVISLFLGVRLSSRGLERKIRGRAGDQFIAVRSEGEMPRRQLGVDERSEAGTACSIQGGERGWLRADFVAQYVCTSDARRFPEHTSGSRRKKSCAARAG